MRHSNLGSRHQSQVRQDGQCSSLVGHKRYALPATVLVLASSTFLAAARLGSWLRRMASRIPQSTQGQYQHSALGHRVRQRYLPIERSNRCYLCAGYKAPRDEGWQARAGAPGIQERWSNNHVGRGREGIVNSGREHT